jgi:hypothetical protein
MKSEWRFDFETRGFVFEKEHKYKATYDEPITLDGQLFEDLEFFIRISPSEKKPPPMVAQIGTLYLTLPKGPAETKAFAYHVAKQIQERITFQSGDFRLKGLFVGKIITETPEEEEKYGDRLYYMDIHLQEVVPPPSFKSNSLVDIPLKPTHISLLSQFNETKNDDSAIRQFLGYFRIIESISHRKGEKQPLKNVLKSNHELRAIYNDIIKDEDFDGFIDKIVNTRHKCAHLKIDKGFGYTPSDPAIKKDLKPYLNILAELAYRAILKFSLTNENS